MEFFGIFTQLMTGLAFFEDLFPATASPGTMTELLEAVGAELVSGKNITKDNIADIGIGENRFERFIARQAIGTSSQSMI
ncbi:MAG: hypothetical protein GY742_18280 [Hyphomicrobiales bacterium]|nr:hypothetical protein [Hyphomicrobiales bacterium]